MNITIESLMYDFVTEQGYNYTGVETKLEIPEHGVIVVQVELFKKDLVTQFRVLPEYEEMWDMLTDHEKYGVQHKLNKYLGNVIINSLHEKKIDLMKKPTLNCLVPSGTLA